jgi:hypothetical protein
MDNSFDRVGEAHQRIIITPRLMWGLRFGVGFISVDNAPTYPGGSPHWKFFIDLPNYSHEGYIGNTHSPVETLEAILSFLGAFEEGIRYNLTGRRSDNADLFPSELADWVGEHSDDMATLSLELSEEWVAIWLR